MMKTLKLLVLGWSILITSVLFASSAREAGTLGGYIEFDFSQSSLLQAMESDAPPQFTIQYVAPSGASSRPVYRQGAAERVRPGVYRVVIPAERKREFRVVWMPVPGRASDYLQVMAVHAYDRTWCEAAVHENLARFDLVAGCPGDSRDAQGINGLEPYIGHVYATPHFDPGYPNRFTNRESPIHASVGG